MADLITTTSGSTWNVYYKGENRQKRIERVSGTATVNDLYSTLQDQFDELNQLDDGTPMSAQTPTEYTIGIIDSGDDEPWFIDNTSVEYLTGGAITTSGWTRTEGSAVGIVRIEYTTGTDFISTDIGKTVSSTEGDSGTLLDYNSSGSTNYAWIRPDSSAAANNWDSATGTITVTGGSAASVTQSAAAVTGEDLWANINTIGTIQDNTHIYIQQNGSLLTAAKDTTDWWADGQIDVLVKVKEMDTEVDEGFITVFARRHASTYSFFTTDLSNGGRTAIPLGAGVDLNNTNGYREMALTTAAGTFAVGDVITDDSDSTISGVVTSVSGSGANQTIQYYLIGDPLNDFTGATGSFTASPSAATATAVAPSDVNSAVLAGTSITFGANTTFDIDENDANETYSIVIDCSDESLADVYAWTQYITRRGGTTTTNTDGIQGQFYLGIESVLQYSGSVTGSITEGNTVTQETSGATGTVVGHDTTNKIITLRNVRGTFSTGATDHTLTDDTTAGTVEIDSSADSVTPNTGAYFGTFAGGVWFLARGVVLNNVLSSEATNYVTTTDDGTVTNPPNKVSVTQANTRLGDRIAIFELTAAGGQIDKAQYTSAAASIGDATLSVTNGTKTAIATDTIGKTTGGVLRVVDDSLETEYRIRFSSWSGTTFTFANTTGTADSGTSDTALVDAAVDFTTAAQVGDIVVTAAKGYSYVKEITDASNIVLEGGTLSGFTTGDAYEFNAVPVALTTSDTVYVPLVDSYETTGTDASTGSESSTVTYVSDIPVIIKVRNADNTASTTTPMLPYTASATVTSSGLTNNTIRTKDSIKS